MTLKQALTKDELKAIAANMDKIVQHFQKGVKGMNESIKGGKINE
jgi:hypothetical protein